MKAGELVTARVPVVVPSHESEPARTPFKPLDQGLIDDQQGQRVNREPIEQVAVDDQVVVIDRKEGGE